jgi:predicted AAA+ superfamily ATPase
LEVDFILRRGQVAVEVKGTCRIDPADLRSHQAFAQEYHPKKALLVCNERTPRIHESIHIIPWRDFLSMLWDGTIIS